MGTVGSQRRPPFGAAILAVIVLALGLSFIGCDRDSRELDPTQIRFAWGYVRPVVGGTLGAIPDPDELIVAVSVVHEGTFDVQPGDWFLAAFAAGTAADEDKYGAASGIRFEVKTDPSLWTYPDGSRTALYFAEGRPGTIRCELGRLNYRISGDGADHLTFSTWTARMGTSMPHLKLDQRQQEWTNPGPFELPYHCAEGQKQ